MQLNFDLWKKERENEIKWHETNEENIKNEGKISLAEKKSDLEIKQKEDEIRRKYKKQKYDMTKEIFSDPKLVEMEYLRSQKKLYNRYCAKVNIHQMDGSDPFTGQLDSYIKSAMREKKNN